MEPPIEPADEHLMRRRTNILAITLGVGALSSAAHAGCTPVWSDGRTGGVNGTVRALLATEQQGPILRGLYVGGAFTAVGFAAANNIARWDGFSWSPLASGTSGEVRALTIFDPDDSGPAPASLIAAGLFTAAGGAPASRIASWNGVAWTPLATGVAGRINALAVFDDDGPGPLPPWLIAGGLFTEGNPIIASNLARWDGLSWQPFGQPNNEILVLSALRGIPGIDPGVTALVAGGWFDSFDGAPISRVALRAPLAGWAPIAQGIQGEFPRIAQSAAVFTPIGSTQPTLYIGGFFTIAGNAGVQGFAQWDGAAWNDVAGGIGFPAEARAALVFDDDGDGPNAERLFVIGNFLPVVGAPANHIATWDGAAWSGVAGGLGFGSWTAAIFDDDGAGPDPPALFVGGEFTSVGANPAISAPRLARYGCPRTAPPPCPDANADAIINFSDITTVLAAFATDYRPATGPGDANRDGVVNFSDITAVLSNWGADCRP